MKRNMPKVAALGLLVVAMAASDVIVEFADVTQGAGVPDRAFNGGLFISSAEAVVGRPMTPMSYAGVARRTSRRTVRRSAYAAGAASAAVAVAALPPGCVYGPYADGNYYNCNGVYYAKEGSGYVKVEFVEE